MPGDDVFPFTAWDEVALGLGRVLGIGEVAERKDRVRLFHPRCSRKKSLGQVCLSWVLLEDRRRIEKT